jgi:hypothetical protein
MARREGTSATAGLALLAALAVSILASGSFAEEPAAARPPGSHPRIQEVHALAAKILPPPHPARPREDVANVRRALEALEAAIEAAQGDPSAAALAVVRQRSEAAQAAFGALRTRLIADGGRELADDLAQRFEPLWADVDSALAATTRRRESLGDARARVAAATRRPGEPRGTTLSVVPLSATE